MSKTVPFEEAHWEPCCQGHPVAYYLETVVFPTCPTFLDVYRRWKNLGKPNLSSDHWPQGGESIQRLPSSYPELASFYTLLKSAFTARVKAHLNGTATEDISLADMLPFVIIELVMTADLDVEERRQANPYLDRRQLLQVWTASINEHLLLRADFVRSFIDSCIKPNGPHTCILRVCFGELFDDRQFSAPVLFDCFRRFQPLYPKFGTFAMDAAYSEGPLSWRTPSYEDPRYSTLDPNSFGQDSWFSERGPNSFSWYNASPKPGKTSFDEPYIIEVDGNGYKAEDSKENKEIPSITFHEVLNAPASRVDLFKMLCETTSNASTNSVIEDPEGWRFTDVTTTEDTSQTVTLQHKENLNNNRSTAYPSYHQGQSQAYSQDVNSHQSRSPMGLSWLSDQPSNHTQQPLHQHQQSQHQQNQYSQAYPHLKQRSIHQNLTPSQSGHSTNSAHPSFLEPSIHHWPQTMPNVNFCPNARSPTFASRGPPSPLGPSPLVRPNLTTSYSSGGGLNMGGPDSLAGSGGVHARWQSSFGYGAEDAATMSTATTTSVETNGLPSQTASSASVPSSNGSNSYEGTAGSTSFTSPLHSPRQIGLDVQEPAAAGGSVEILTSSAANFVSLDPGIAGYGNDSRLSNMNGSSGGDSGLSRRSSSAENQLHRQNSSPAFSRATALIPPIGPIYTPPLPHWTPRGYDLGHLTSASTYQKRRSSKAFKRVYDHPSEASNGNFDRDAVTSEAEGFQPNSSYSTFDERSTRKPSQVPLTRRRGEEEEEEEAEMHNVNCKRMKVPSQATARFHEDHNASSSLPSILSTSEGTAASKGSEKKDIPAPTSASPPPPAAAAATTTTTTTTTTTKKTTTQVKDRAQQNRDKMKRYAARVKRQREALKAIWGQVQRDSSARGLTFPLNDHPISTTKGKGEREKRQDKSSGAAAAAGRRAGASNTLPEFSSQSEKLNYQKRASKARKRSSEQEHLDGILNVARLAAAALRQRRCSSSNNNATVDDDHDHDHVEQGKEGGGEEGEETQVLNILKKVLTLNRSLWEDLLEAEKRLSPSSSSSTSASASASTYMVSTTEPPEQGTGNGTGNGNEKEKGGSVLQSLFLQLLPLHENYPHLRGEVGPSSSSFASCS